MSLSGVVGGLLVGIVVMAASFSLFAHIDEVKDSDIPMLAIVNSISPVVAYVHSIAIFALIFNTAFSAPEHWVSPGWVSDYATVGCDLIQKFYVRHYRMINIVLALTLLECVWSMLQA